MSELEPAIDVNVMQIMTHLASQLTRNLTAKLKEHGIQDAEKIAKDVSSSSALAPIRGLIDESLRSMARTLASKSASRTNRQSERRPLTRATAEEEPDDPRHSTASNITASAPGTESFQTLLAQHTKACVARRASVGARTPGATAPTTTPEAARTSAAGASGSDGEKQPKLKVKRGSTSGQDFEKMFTSQANQQGRRASGAATTADIAAAATAAVAAEEAAKKSEPAPFVSFMARAKRRASVAVGIKRAQKTQPTALPAAQPAAEEAKRAELVRRRSDHDDKFVARAVAAGHSPSSALNRVRRPSEIDAMSNDGSIPSGDGNVVPPTEQALRMLRRPSSSSSPPGGRRMSEKSGSPASRRNSLHSDVSAVRVGSDASMPRFRSNTSQASRVVSMSSMQVHRESLTIAELLADSMVASPEESITYTATEQNKRKVSTSSISIVDEDANNGSMQPVGDTHPLMQFCMSLPMLEPISRTRLAWDLAVTLAAATVLAIMPLGWSFPGWTTAATATGAVSCPIFFLHLLIQLRTAVPQHGMLNRHPGVVMKHYVISFRFVTDLLTALAYPIQTLTSPHVTLLNLVALRHILFSCSKLERAIKASHATRRVLVLAIVSVVVAHWMACTWAMLADPDKTMRASLRGIPVNAPDELMPESWFSLYNASLHAPREADDWVVYLYALYWTLATTTTIGFGDVLPANEIEIGVICLTICVSAVLYSSLIAYISNLILASDVNWTAHKQKVETIKSYMRHRHIPTTLQARIEEYMDYLWTTQKGVNENAITGLLPDTLKQQLSLYCNQRIISTVPLFKDVPEHVSAAIVMQLQPRIFVPEDMIITQGELADEMFLIFRGVVKLVELSEQEGRGIYLKDGDYFGEIAVLTGGKRMMSIRAVTYCHLYSLQQKLLERILQQYPECINNLLTNMMDTYENFEEIRTQIFALAGLAEPAGLPRFGSEEPPSLEGLEPA